MGGNTFDLNDYKKFTDNTRGMKTEEIYKSKSIKNNLNPKGVKIRESRDSEDNPKSTPIIIALDVTGSMGMLADKIAREGLGILFKSILERRPVSDPHIMFMGIGDANYDSAPLQISQFEADNRIVEQLTDLYLEGGGGGNNFESYNLAWYFAAFHTVHDSFEKRGKRGYLFTVGDEPAPEDLTQGQIKKFIGDDLQQPLSSMEMLRIVERTYDTYHIVIEQGHYCQNRPERVMKTWKEMLGQKVIPLSHYEDLAQTIVSAIEVAEGIDVEVSASHWEGKTKDIVHRAVKGLPGRRIVGTQKALGRRKI